MRRRTGVYLTENAKISCSPARITSLRLIPFTVRTDRTIVVQFEAKIATVLGFGETKPPVNPEFFVFVREMRLLASNTQAPNSR